MKIKGILWDLDGVLADTQSWHSRAESDAMAEIGLSVAPEEIGVHFAGTTDRPLFQSLLLQHHRKADAEAVESLIARKKFLLFGRMDREGVPWVAGAKELFYSFAATGLPMAVASSSTIEFIEYVVKALGIHPHLHNLTSGHEVPKSKPEPEVFLLAAKRLGVDPAQALVLEDSANGLTAARRAHMRAVALWPDPAKAPPCSYAVPTWVGQSAPSLLAKVEG